MLPGQQPLFENIPDNVKKAIAPSMERIDELSKLMDTPEEEEEEEKPKPKPDYTEVTYTEVNHRCKACGFTGKIEIAFNDWQCPGCGVTGRDMFMKPVS